MISLDGLLTPEEVAILREWLSTAEFEDGGRTAGGLARTVKNNEQLRGKGADRPEYDQIVATALARHPLFAAWAIPTRMTAVLYSRYRSGMKYGAHVDDAVAQAGNRPLRRDISTTIFLSDPADYTGGELTIETPSGPKTVKGAAGSGFAYLTNALHQVQPLKGGERLVAVVWAQSLIADDRIRQVLFDLTAVSQSLSESGADSSALKLLTKARQNLTRIHAVP